MKLLKYSDALKAGKAKIGNLLVPVRVKRAQKQAELEMCKLEEKVANDQAKLVEVCSSEELNFENIIIIQDRLALNERRIKQYQLIIDQMFGE
jgi:hypothetical protein